MHKNREDNWADLSIEPPLGTWYDECTKKISMYKKYLGE
nr:MAG TPA: hypothetical protein [Caudoviricetes sp.]